VWWWDDWSWPSIRRASFEADGAYATIFKWFLVVGPIEIRRWYSEPDGHVRLREYQQWNEERNTAST